MGIDFKCSSELLQQFEERWTWTLHHCQWVGKCQRTLALKCQGEEGYKDRVMVVVCCSTDGSEKLHPLESLENHITWKVWGITHMITNHLKLYGWLENCLEWLVSFQRKTTCQNWHVLLLIDHYAAHSNEGCTLKHVHIFFLLPNTTTYVQPLDQGIIYCMKQAYPRHRTCFFATRNRQECFCRRQENGTFWMSFKILIFPRCGTPSCLQ